MDDGIITEIYIEHFVTYEKSLIKPGRYLNVVIGPNGTGKSTIVCAIVIGLGGNLSIIGRAKNVGDYVKTGHDKAKIQISLRTKNSEVKICRNFDKQSVSVWQIDGQNVNQKSVQELVSKFNIQMDNLCQFLPQEKVQEFSNLTSENLLIETLRSVGDPSLLTMFSKLKELRLKHIEVDQFIKDKSSYLQQQTDKYENLKEIVGNIKEKKKMKKRVETLIQKKAWMLYDETRMELMKRKEDRDKLEKQIENLNKQLKPIKLKMEKLQLNVSKLSSEDSSQKKELLEKVTKIKNLMNKINNLDEEVQETEETWKQRLDIENRREQDIQLSQTQLEKLKIDLQNFIDECGSDADMKGKQRSILHEIDVQRKEATTLKDHTNQLRQQDDALHREIESKNIEMQRVQNIKTKRMELLRQLSEHAYEGALWLQKNRDKFSSPVHEPILLNINVKNKQHAKYLENIIPVRDLIAFVCEDKEDMNQLVHYLRNERKLQVNVLHSDPDKNVNMNPYIPIERIKQYGFENYLISLLEAPPTIMKYLVSIHNLHNIPYGNSAVDSNFTHIPHEISVFLSENSKYVVSVSKYTGAKSVSIDSIAGRDILTITIDTALIQGIAERLDFLQKKRITVSNDIKALNERLDNTNKKLEQLRGLRNQYQQNLSQITSLKSKIERMEEKVRELESEKMSLDNINEMYKKNIQDILRVSIKIYEEINKMMKECYDSTVFNEIGRLSINAEKLKLAKIKSDSTELRNQLELSTRTFKQFDSDLLPLKNAAMKKLEEAKDLTYGLTPNDSGFRKIQGAFNKLPVTLPEIENLLSESKAKLYCMGKDSDGEEVLKNYETTKINIEETNTIIKQKTQELNKQLDKMEELRNSWYPKVDKLSNEINQNFSEYFSNLNCSGELSLVHDYIYDFDKYGLKIMVKFRDTDILQELTRTHQSGGERALTTAVYMIALQNLSRVPFRCVDEINQGMDPINERRVFQLLVKITGSSKGSQYFFITPKLLPELEYPHNVTIHCIYNGPFVIPHTEFDISEYTKNINKILSQ